MTPAEMARAQRGLIEFAERRGLVLSEIFIEKLESVPEAFAKLAARVSEPGERIVIIPGIHHLAGLGDPPLSVLRAFAADGVQVLIAGHVE
ncbi:hypothetical protein GCM10029976_080390 [Kribbella albertanoniae]|uniref:Recombinase family protein n=1 Tax=Kribbella albertanoniae TaxID=1266829 RepID=A0A4R4P065_9ACTN|nr:hypothetical protein [Kribbella albertanoniae]TDC13960.1 hypothetical protein E1261_44440 [Kribbella albertanoniae]